MNASDFGSAGPSLFLVRCTSCGLRFEPELIFFGEEGELGLFLVSGRLGVYVVWGLVLGSFVDFCIDFKISGSRRQQISFFVAKL